MATAKQIAARKAFTKIMQSGGFAKAGKRKTAAKRKRNPVARHPGAEMPYQAVSKLDFDRQIRALSGRAKPRKRNPVARHGGGGRNIYATNAGMPDFTRQSRALSGRKANPLKVLRSFIVYAARGGVAGKVIGAFPAKSDAVQYAKAWSSLHNCPAIIQGRA